MGIVAEKTKIRLVSFLGSFLLTVVAGISALSLSACLDDNNPSVSVGEDTSVLGDSGAEPPDDSSPTLDPGSSDSDALTNTNDFKIFRASISSDGTQANADSGSYIAINDNGHYIAFSSFATNLVKGDSNGESDVFVFDRISATTKRVSISSDGEEGNGASFSPEISGDGQFVVFRSRASNLVPNDTNGKIDSFIHNLSTGETERISINSNGVESDGDTVMHQISTDGRYVLFTAYGRSLTSGQTHFGTYLRDRTNGDTSLLTDAAVSNQIHMSSDARFVVFSSWSADLLPEDNNGSLADIFLLDRSTGELSLVSVSSNGVQANRSSQWPTISEDGRYISYLSQSTNLIGSDTGGNTQVYVHDRETSVTELVTQNASGETGNANSYYAWISADGSRITYGSAASNLVENDTNKWSDIFVFNIESKTTTRVNETKNNDQGNGYSSTPRISGDGSIVTFLSKASNLVDGDTNNKLDVFAVQMKKEAPDNNRPIILTPDNIEVPENTTFVTTIDARDSDGDELTYSLLSSPDLDKFTVNGAGQLSFLTAPDFENPEDVDRNNLYQLSIQVSDTKGGIAGKALTIKVLDDKNEKPNNDSDDDGLPNDWEDQHGLDKNNPDDANVDKDGDGFSNMQEFMAGTNPNNNKSHDGNKPPAIPAPAENPLGGIVDPKNPVGFIKGDFLVSNSGAATYEIPIAIPPGTAGTEPKINLNYNSQNNSNGVVGMGWSIGGQSAILRCPKTLATDGKRGSINFDADDRFCLDGQRLIMTVDNGHHYGGDGTKYHTEIDNHSEITSVDKNGDQKPDSFYITTKSGETIFYGSSDDSMDIVNEGAYSWRIKKVRDRKGNYFIYHYNTGRRLSQLPPPLIRGHL